MKHHKQSNKSYERLKALIGQDTIIRVRRDRIDEYNLNGFVVGLSGFRLLLHVVDGTSLRLDGYSAVRLRDVTDWWVDNHFSCRALRLLEHRPVVPDGIDLADWPSVLRSAQLNYPLITVEMEARAPGLLYIGRITKLGKRRVSLKAVNPQGHWGDKAVKFEFRNITKVVFGSRYAAILAKLLEHEAQQASCSPQPSE